MPFNSTLALIKTHQPLRLHLEAALKRPVEIYTSADYAAFHRDSLAGALRSADYRAALRRDVH
jgi:phosphonate transport system substrate-binding protein